jgi:hypothetical protein
MSSKPGDARFTGIGLIADLEGQEHMTIFENISENQKGDGKRILPKLFR